MKFQFNDGGRVAAGYKGSAGDCVCRSIAIATGKPYKEIYDFLAEKNSTQRTAKRERKKKSNYKVKTARNGIFTNRKWFKDYMRSLGFEWVATMHIGQGCKVHLRETEMPMTGKLVVSLSRHYTAVIDGVINDTHNPDRNGWRCVYGYYKLCSKC